MTIGPAGSRRAYTTFYRNTEDGIDVSCGCFNGSIEEFLKKVEETHGSTHYARVYNKAAELAIVQIEDRQIPDKSTKMTELLERLDSEIDRRTAIEKEHERLVCAGDFEGAVKVLKTMDDSIIRGIREEIERLEGKG